MPEPLPSPGDTPRRGFIKSAAALFIGSLALLGPVVAGMVAFVSPLSKKKDSGATFRRVATLDAVPADGKAYRFAVVADRDDSWSHYPPESVGSIYLVRTAEASVPTAFNSICPHLGCNVDWKPATTSFLCPCHNAAFAVSGARTDAASPSPRDLDTLAVEIRNGNEVWVDYRVFKGGIAEKVTA
jgi:menaquinol-cytochrome c reductase iron-sulfur subunit